MTGSRIKRADIEGVGPATVVGAPEIANTGVVNVETLLQRLPAAAGFAGNQTNAYWTASGWGTAQVNLRGLGINRTLVLLNGRRLVDGGTGANSAPDLNTIPASHHRADRGAEGRRLGDLRHRRGGRRRQHHHPHRHRRLRSRRHATASPTRATATTSRPTSPTACAASAAASVRGQLPEDSRSTWSAAPAVRRAARPAAAGLPRAAPPPPAGARPCPTAR